MNRKKQLIQTQNHPSTSAKKPFPSCHSPVSSRPAAKRPLRIMANKDQTDTARMEKIVSLCKRKGFIFQSAELYGGLNGCWELGVNRQRAELAV